MIMMTIQLVLQRMKNHQRKKNHQKIVKNTVDVKRKKKRRRNEKKKKIETVITPGKNQKSN